MYNPPRRPLTLNQGQSKVAFDERTKIGALARSVCLERKLLLLGCWHRHQNSGVSENRFGLYHGSDDRDVLITRQGR